MSILSHCWAKLIGLVTGGLLFGWYLAFIITDRATAKMLIFIPILQYYEPTVFDYLLGVILSVVGGGLVYWTLTRAKRLLPIKALS